MPASGTPVPPPFGAPLPLASPGARFGAVAIDLVGTVLATLAIAVGMISLGFAGYNGVSGTNGDLVLGGALAIVVVPVASVVLNMITTIVWGRTVGKHLVGLRVVDQNTLATPAPGQILLRTLVLVAPILVVIPVMYLATVGPAPSLGIPGVGIVLVGAYWFVLMVLMMARPEIAPLQDRAGRTVVVTTRPRPGSTEPLHSAS
jgi:uncharacterized RDD family membrane protein YckC